MRRFCCLLLAAVLLLLTSAIVVSAAGESCQKCGKNYNNGFCGCGFQEPVLASDGYYEIGNAGQLYSFAGKVNGGLGDFKARLTADIVVNRNVLKSLTFWYNGEAQGGEKLRAWTPMGHYNSDTDNVYAYGEFDGCGHTISGLYFKDARRDYVGLFGYGTVNVRDLRITDSYFRGRFYIGAVLGGNGGQGGWSIENCRNEATIMGIGYIGGIVGSSIGSVTDCSNYGRIYGSQILGGIVGTGYFATARDCRNYGTITANGSTVGGILGKAKGCEVSGCANWGTIRGGGTVGGIVAANSDGAISDCFNHGAITGSNRQVGGIAGNSGAIDKKQCVITGCGNTGTVSGISEVGGILGYHWVNGSNILSLVENCWNTGDVIALQGYQDGGIVGYNMEKGNGDTLVRNCFTMKNVAVGDNLRGSVTNCYYSTDGAIDLCEYGIPMTDELFASGYVAIRLGEPFGQNLDNGNGNPGYPELGAPAVYAIEARNCQGGKLMTVYSNFRDTQVIRHSYENGVCTLCGDIRPGDGILRLAGENRFETAFLVADRMKEALGLEKFDAVIIASGANFADALSGSYLANVKRAPILLAFNETYNNMAKDYIRANLKEGGTVYILGGAAAVDSSMDSGLEGFAVKRLAGDNRFETNLLILKEAGVADGEEILVCTGTNFADSLSASATGKPILLVYNESGKLTQSQTTWLSGLDGCRFCVIGGKLAVGTALEGAVGQYGGISRVAGENRFDTSVLVARRYFPDPEVAVLAYAWNYPDGLCGGPLAYALGCPLVLTMSCREEQAEAYAEDRGITGGIVLGGEKLISAQSAETICREGGKTGHDYRAAGARSACAKCGQTTTPSLTINTKNETCVWVGETLQLDYTYTGSGKLSFTTEDWPAIVVEDSGLVAAMSTGDYRVTVSDGTLTKSITLRVRELEDDPKAKYIRLDSAEEPFFDGVTKYAGWSMQIKVSAVPGVYKERVVYTSSDPSVLTVEWDKSQKGSGDQDSTWLILTFKSAGTSTLTFTSADGLASMSFTVHVKDGYDFDPGDRMLTPEEFGEYAEMVMEAHGIVDYDPWRELYNSELGWLPGYLEPKNLTFDYAAGNGVGHVQTWWHYGQTQVMQIEYIGISEFGHEYHFCR